MSTINSSSSGKVPMGQKIAFGLGMLANQMFPAMIGIFTVVLIENIGFSGLLLGLTYFIPKFYDALFDLVMGFRQNLSRVLAPYAILCGVILIYSEAVSDLFTSYD